MDIEATIAAVASAPGHSERGIVRIGGPTVSDVLARLDLAFPADVSIPLRIDKTVSVGLTTPCPVSVYFWPGTRSYTGQPMAELHVPGSPPLLELVLARVYACGARPARSGEFTLRAFLAGKLDLAQAEAVLGVIDAFDYEELNTALRQLAGGLSGLILELRNQLAELLADLEAGLDFVEEDIEFISQSEITRRLAAATTSVDGLLSRVSERLQSVGTQRIALAGRPNAGKSTLFNALTADSLTADSSAIVSDEAGTTRDYLSHRIDCGGIPVELIDTAGWESAQTGVGNLAQQFRLEQVGQADLVVWCSAADSTPQLRQTDRTLFDELTQTRPAIEVRTRADLVSGSLGTGSLGPAALSAADLAVSAVTGEGLEQLVSTIAERLMEQHRGERQFVGSTAARSRSSLSRAHESLCRAGEAAAAGLGDELTSLEIRDALDALGEIVGAIYTEDLLDRVFSRFCIGK